ncbi:MAG: HIT family protein [Candidatus Hodarchaeota archaeon]
MSNCIFCQIITGEAPSYRIFEDEKTLVFLDIYPIARGHALVIPKVQSGTLYEIKAEDMAAVGVTVSRVARVLKNVLKCDGINVYQGNERAGLQEIMHVHFHVIPRWFKDSIVLTAKRIPLEEDSELIKDLSEAFNLNNF